MIVDGKTIPTNCPFCFRSSPDLVQHVHKFCAYAQQYQVCASMPSLLGVTGLLQPMHSMHDTHACGLASLASMQVEGNSDFQYTYTPSRLAQDKDVAGRHLQPLSNWLRHLSEHGATIEPLLEEYAKACQRAKDEGQRMPEFNVYTAPSAEALVWIAKEQLDAGLLIETGAILLRNMCQPGSSQEVPQKVSGWHVWQACTACG